MCGIVAHLGFTPQARLDEGQINALNQWHAHRGPDGSGVYLDAQLGLGARRLAIVDVQGGAQPITSHDGRYTIVFNGEIYNYKEIRRQLLAKGYPLKTNSDTEALLYAFINGKEACLQDLNGMFAFCVWDKKEKTLFAARDRLGIKPLYYAINKERALFSSELRAISHSALFDLSWDMQAISDYLAYWYVCQPRTVFQEVKQLPPGHFAYIREGQMQMKSWWQLPCQAEKAIVYNEACRQLEELLKDAVKLRLQADVPVGILLSGGIDSGVMAALAARQGHTNLHAFSIGFGEKSYDELPLAQLTAAKNKIQLHTTVLKSVNTAQIEEAISKLDEPLGNASYVPAYFLSKLAAGTVKSVLGGDGGDELFGGYPTYQAIYYQDMWRRTPSIVQNVVKGISQNLPVSHKRISFDFRVKQLMKGIDKGYAYGHYVWRQVASLERQASLMRPEVYAKLAQRDPFVVSSTYFQEAKNLSVQNRLMYVDLKTYLMDDHLRKVDRMSMACGLEVRLPYLDYRVVELAMQLPAAYKVNLRRTKIILKQIARPLLPREVLRGTKKGLTSPIAGWLKGPLADYTRSQMSDGILTQLFDTVALQALFDEHKAFKADHSRLLWALLTFSVWSKSLPKKVALR